MAEQIEIAGERLRLRSTVADDGPALVAIRSTDVVRSRWRGGDLAAEVAADLDDDALVQLTIEVGGTIIGLIQFSEEEDPDYRHASLDIYLDPAVHGRGYGAEAVRTLVDYLFDERHHHRLTIDPAADNQPAIRCYASVGFRPVGVMRGYERRRDGSWADGLLMELLAGDQTEPDPLDTQVPEALELQLLTPAVRGDADALDALLHDDFVEVGASGHAWTRDEMIAALVASPDPGPVEVDDLRARLVGGGAVLVTYRARTSWGTALRSSLWIVDRGRWRVRFHQGTPTNSDTTPGLHLQEPL